MNLEIINKLPTVYSMANFLAFSTNTGMYKNACKKRRKKGNKQHVTYFYLFNIFICNDFTDE